MADAYITKHPTICDGCGKTIKAGQVAVSIELKYSPIYLCVECAKGALS